MFKWLMGSANVSVPVIVLLLIGISVFDVGIDMLRQFKEVITVPPSKPPAATDAPVSSPPQPQVRQAVQAPTSNQWCNGKDDSVFLGGVVSRLNPEWQKCRLLLEYQGHCIYVWVRDNMNAEGKVFCHRYGNQDPLPPDISGVSADQASFTLKYKLVPR